MSTGEVEERQSTGSGVSSGFWLGIVIGGIIGAGVAYLTAEDKSKLRRSLINKGRILLEHWDDFKEDVGEKGKDIENKVLSKLESTKEEARDVVEEIPSVARDALDNVQKTADKAIEKIVEAADKTEVTVHQKARKFFFSKGRPLMKK